MTTTLTPIRSFVDGLCAIPEPEFSRERVLEEFGRIVLDPASINPYLYFSPSHYTRNLVHYCDLFEVIAICWEVGQASMIHNHREQECWMGAPIGRLMIQNYRLDAQCRDTKTCQLTPTLRYTLDATHSAAVDPGEPIHSVNNLAEFGERAVSVHVYSKPFDSCEVYNLEKGIYYDIPLEYTSRYGELCASSRDQRAVLMSNRAL